MLNFQGIAALYATDTYKNMNLTDFQTALNTQAVVSNRSYFISGRTVYGYFLNQGDEGLTKAKALLAALQSYDPNLYAMMLVPGDQYGTSGGMDMGLPTTQGLVASLAAGVNEAAGTTVITADDIAGLQAFGQVIQSPANTLGFPDGANAAQVDFAINKLSDFNSALSSILTKANAANDSLNTLLISVNANTTATIPSVQTLLGF